MTRKIPDVGEVARLNPRFDCERLARFEKCQELAGGGDSEVRRYRLAPVLGELVTISDQTLVSISERPSSARRG